MISTSHVFNLTQKTIFGLSFTNVEYLIWFSSKGSVSSEYSTETNCFKAAVSSNKVWPNRADTVMWKAQGLVIQY